MTNQTTTDFGYEQVAPEEKTRRVVNVFTSVASEYDLMNDIMSFGAHRLWKRQAVHLCAIRKNFHVLDLAGGTGDIARLIHNQLGNDGRVTLCDITVCNRRVTIDFTEEGIRRIAEIAEQVNESIENIGARRLHTVMERLLETLSYEASEKKDQSISIDEEYVNDHLNELVKDEDLSRYIL